MLVKTLCANINLISLSFVESAIKLRPASQSLVDGRCILTMFNSVCHKLLDIYGLVSSRC